MTPLASIFRRGRVYYVQFHDSRRAPSIRRRSLRTKDRAVAETLTSRLETLWASGVYDPWSDAPLPLPPTSQVHKLAGRSWKIVLKAFLESRRRRQRSKRTIQSYKSVIRLFFRRSGLATVAEVRPGDVETFIWNLSVAPGTRAARDRHLRAFFRWAVDEGILTSDPSSGLDRPVQPEKVPRNVTANELQRICTSIKADYRLKRSRGRCRDGELLWLIPVFQFAFLTGLRAAEIARLRWGDVDRPNGRLFLWRQKNGRESVLPISRKADDILHDLEAGPPDAYVFRSPRTPSVRRSESSFAIQVSRAFTRYRNAARIKRPVTFHGLRHGFCTTLAEAGKSAVVIQAAARHRSLSTSMRYVHLAGDFLRAELDDAFA